MTLETETPLDTEDEVDDPELGLEEPSEEVDVDPVAALTAEVASLKSQLERPAWMDEFKANTGRIRSIEARLQKAEDPTDRTALQRQLEAKLSVSNELLASLMTGLDDTAFIDPSLKTRAAALLNENREKEREERLLQKLRDENKPAQVIPQQDVPESHRVWELEWEDRIKEDGFDPDGADWSAVWPKVATLLKGGGTLIDASTLMKAQLKTLKDERTSARQRQATKRSAGNGSPRGTGGAVDILNDPNKTREEKAAYLRKQGVTVG